MGGVACVRVPAFALGAAVVDTTGAGDAFVGALAAMLSRRHQQQRGHTQQAGDAAGAVMGEGRFMEAALAVASWAGALSCMAEGARGGMPRIADAPPHMASLLSMGE